MEAFRDRIVERLHALPDYDLREVLDFVDFLKWRTGQQDDALLSVAGTLSGESLSSEEIERELYGSAQHD